MFHYFKLGEMNVDIKCITDHKMVQMCRPKL